MYWVSTINAYKFYKTTAMNSFTVTTEVPMDSSHAWEYYFNQISSWWPKEYHTSQKTKRFIIDTFIGGKAYEDHGEGGGLIWADVIGVDYPHALQMRGNLTKEFGGPSLSFEKITFETVEGGCQVTYSADFIGNVTERSIKSLKDGWIELLKVHFKGYCEERTNRE